MAKYVPRTCPKCKDYLFLLIIGSVLFSGLVLCAQTALGASKEKAENYIVLVVPLGAPRNEVEGIFSKAQVKQLFRDKLQTGYIEPAVKIRDGGMTLLVFHKDKLAKVGMVINVKSQRAEPYVSRYGELKQALTQKYGKPKKSQEWIDKDYLDHKLLALKTGKAHYFSTWQLPNLRIALI